MSEFTVYFTQVASTQVTVEAEDFDEAIDLAWEQVPGNVCAQCSGWGNRVGIDLSGDWIPDEDGYYVDGKWVDASKT